MPADQLLINDMTVSDLRLAMREGAFGLSNAPDLVKRIIREGAWRERTLKQNGKHVTFARFTEFVAAPPLDGLGTDLATIKRLCRDDVEAVDLIDQATKGKQGERTDLVANVHDVIEDRPSGNSRQRTVRRLREQFPDLHKQVLAGDLSANEAAIQAGFRKRTITVPLDPNAAAATLRRHFTGELWQQLLAALES